MLLVQLFHTLPVVFGVATHQVDVFAMKRWQRWQTIVLALAIA